jgi:hypothetical protein
MKNRLKLIAGVFVGLAAGIGFPLLINRLPQDHHKAFSGIAHGLGIFMQILSPVVIAVVLGAYAKRYLKARKQPEQQ